MKELSELYSDTLSGIYEALGLVDDLATVEHLRTCFGNYCTKCGDEAADLSRLLAVNEALCQGCWNK